MLIYKLPKYKVEATYAVAKFVHELFAPIFKEYKGIDYSIEDFLKRSFSVYFEGPYLCVLYDLPWLDTSLEFSLHRFRDNRNVSFDLFEIVGPHLEVGSLAHKELKSRLVFKLNTKKATVFFNNALSLYYRVPKSKGLYYEEPYMVFVKVRGSVVELDVARKGTFPTLRYLS